MSTSPATVEETEPPSETVGAVTNLPGNPQVNFLYSSYHFSVLATFFSSALLCKITPLNAVFINFRAVVPNLGYVLELLVVLKKE